MVDPTDWKRRITKCSWVQRAIELAGSAWPALAALAGLSMFTALLGFATDQPHWAIVAAMSVAAIGFKLFCWVSEWVNANRLEYKLTLRVLPPVIDYTNDHVNVGYHFEFENNADFDIFYKVIDDHYSAGAQFIRDDAHISEVRRVPVNKPALQAAPKIRNVNPALAKEGVIQMTVLCGKNPTQLKCRWELRVRIELAAVFDIEAATYASGAALAWDRNEYSWVG